MNKDTRNMLKYLKEDEQVEVPSYESFRNQILIRGMKGGNS